MIKRTKAYKLVLTLTVAINVANAGIIEQCKESSTNMISNMRKADLAAKYKQSSKDIQYYIKQVRKYAIDTIVDCKKADPGASAFAKEMMDMAR